MDRADVEVFLNRDWARIARSKREYWADRKRRLGPAEGLRAAGELHRFTKLLRPDWPTPRQRDEDIATHARVARLLHDADRSR